MVPNSWIWTALMFLFTIGDIVMGGVTLFYCWMTIPRFGYILDRLDQQKFSREVAYYGMISVAFVAIACVFCGFRVLCKFYKVKPEDFRYYIIKFFSYFITELIGFGAPYLVIKEYDTKVKFIMSCVPNFTYTKFYYLLLINPITIGLFIYQFVSILVAYKFIKSLEDRVNQQRNISVQYVAAPAPAIATATASNPQITISTSAWTEGETTRPQGTRNATQNRTNQNSSAGNGTRGNSSSSGRTVYPNLENLRQDLDLPPTSLTAAAATSTSVSGPCYSKKSGFLQLKTNCLKSGILYKDPNFPATHNSLQIPNESFQWKRPHEISKNPQFITDGVSRFDVNQGILGNCWFLAAVGNLTLHPGLFDQVVPSDNSWTNRSDYAGIFHFRFWFNGTWQEVIVDDRLPTQRGQLVFMQSKDVNEFWSSLLEKAYAKLHGCYQELDGGRIGRAMGHLTAGQVESIHLKNLDCNELFRQMKSALNKGCLIGCSTDDTERLRVRGKGLVGDHAYSVTGIKMVRTKSRGEIGLIRIRNPWGNHMEWSGDWSDRHILWKQVDKKTRRELQLIFKADGEFWFPLKEFSKYFDELEICYLN